MPEAKRLLAETTGCYDFLETSPPRVDLGEKAPELQ